VLQVRVWKVSKKISLTRPVEREFTEQPVLKCVKLKTSSQTPSSWRK
jgi:hypothetical protein